MHLTLSPKLEVYISNYSNMPRQYGIRKISDSDIVIRFGTVRVFISLTDRRGNNGQNYKEGAAGNQ